MLSKTIFISRLQSIVSAAINTDRSCYPKIRDINDAVADSPELRAMLSIGTVLSSLCSGITTNVKTTGAASTPQSVMSISAAIRWCLSFLLNTDKLEEFGQKIYESDEYASFLFDSFMNVNHTMLAGFIAGIGLQPHYHSQEVVDSNLDNWAFEALVNLLSFCAARDISPEL